MFIQDISLLVFISRQLRRKTRSKEYLEPELQSIKTDLKIDKNHQKIVKRLSKNRQNIVKKSSKKSSK